MVFSGNREHSLLCLVTLRAVFFVHGFVRAWESRLERYGGKEFPAQGGRLGVSNNTVTMWYVSPLSMPRSPSVNSDEDEGAEGEAAEGVEKNELGKSLAPCSSQTAFASSFSSRDPTPCKRT